MTTSTRICVYGSGRTASEIIAALRLSPYELAAAVVHSPDKAGRDVGELTGQGETGVLTTADLDAVLSAGAIDVLLYAGLAGECHHRAIASCVAAGVDQVHASFVDPRAALPPQMRREMQAAAQRSGSRVVGTGMIPGLWLDVLPVLLMSGLPKPVSVRAQRTSNISSWGRDVLRHEIGIGRAASGASVRVDELLRESAGLIADALGLTGHVPDSGGGLVRAIHAAEVGGISVRAGEAVGFDQYVAVSADGIERLRLAWAGQGDTDVALADDSSDVVLTLTGGDATELAVRISTPADPYPGTAARMLHAVHGLRSLPAGLQPPTALPVY